MRKERAYSRKAYNGRREANRERNSRSLSSSSYLQPSVLEPIFVIQMAFGACAPNKYRKKLGQNCA